MNRGADVHEGESEHHDAERNVKQVPQGQEPTTGDEGVDLHLEPAALGEQFFEIIRVTFEVAVELAHQPPYRSPLSPAQPGSQDNASRTSGPIGLVGGPDLDAEHSKPTGRDLNPIAQLGEPHLGVVGRTRHSGVNISPDEAARNQDKHEKRQDTRESVVFP